jgi:hypothetical protein
MEINVGKTMVMRISKNPLSLQIMIDSKTGECGIFQIFGSIIMIDARYTREIKSRIAVVKTTFNKEAHFTSKLDLNFRKNLVDCYIWSIGLYGSESRTHRKVDHQYPNFFEMWCWRRMEKIS